MPRIQLKRGLKANLPTSAMLAGEPLVTTDRGTLHIATDATTKLPIVPAIDDLSTLASVNGAADLILIHDADGVGQKEKKITFDAFKTALNIPAASTDEKVAVVTGGTSGYICLYWVANLRFPLERHPSLAFSHSSAADTIYR